MSVKVHEDLAIIPWRLDESLRRLIVAHSQVLVSYCMGDLTRSILNHHGPHQTLVCDAYVPNVRQVSAREVLSSALHGEDSLYRNDLQENHWWTRALVQLAWLAMQEGPGMGLLPLLIQVDAYE